ncbi:hypothetical protein [Mycobacteroides abscessus]|uniref:hypothetical protein n=1 Tax=Mycobacteroides abscessus TaxID=36809 RepID=UPI0009A688C8|nr:hypothetical protein [Mycobacteroides abscessus]SLD69382.1 Uncharacterised protein [Mycobacteroides abscessus subsp. massiliense]SLE15771.1 Uncharacterised protein [Mycobacteroides abscessus subsp. massiliense]
MSALTNPADEARVREIVREELAGLKGSDAGLKTSGIRLKLDELLNEPSRLARQLDVPHEGEAVTTDDGDGLTRSWDARTFEYVETVKVVAS